MRDSEQITPQEFRKFPQFEVTFEVATESKDLQPEQTMNSLKILELLRNLIGLELKQTIAPEVKDPKT